jgi:hypothetical protein
MSLFSNPFQFFAKFSAQKGQGCVWARWQENFISFTPNKSE